MRATFYPYDNAPFFVTVQPADHPLAFDHDALLFVCRDGQAPVLLSALVAGVSFDEAERAAKLWIGGFEQAVHELQRKLDRDLHVGIPQLPKHLRDRRRAGSGRGEFEHVDDESYKTLLEALRDTLRAAETECGGLFVNRFAALIDFAMHDSTLGASLAKTGPVRALSGSNDPVQIISYGVDPQTGELLRCRVRFKGDDVDLLAREVSTDEPPAPMPALQIDDRVFIDDLSDPLIVLSTPERPCRALAIRAGFNADVVDGCIERQVLAYRPRNVVVPGATYARIDLGDDAEISVIVRDGVVIWQRS